MVWPDFVQDRLGFLVKEKYIREVGKKGRRSDGPPFRGRSRAGRAVWIGSTPDLTPPPFLLFLFRRCHLPPRHLPPTATPPLPTVTFPPPLAGDRESRVANGAWLHCFPAGETWFTPPARRRWHCGSSRLAASQQQWTIGLLGQAVGHSGRVG